MVRGGSVDGDLNESEAGSDIEVARWGDSQSGKPVTLIINYARRAWSGDVQGVERVLDIRLMLLWTCLCL